MGTGRLQDIKKRVAAMRHSGVVLSGCPRCRPTLSDTEWAMQDREWLIEALERARRHAASARERAKARV